MLILRPTLNRLRSRGAMKATLVAADGCAGYLAGQNRQEDFCGRRCQPPAVSGLKMPQNRCRMEPKGHGKFHRLPRWCRFSLLNRSTRAPGCNSGEGDTMNDRHGHLDGPNPTDERRRAAPRIACIYFARPNVRHLNVATFRQNVGLFSFRPALWRGAATSHIRPREA